MVSSLIKKYKFVIIFSTFLVLEIVLILFLFPLFSNPVSGVNYGGNGTNITVRTTLTVTNVAPEVLTVNVTSNTGLNISLNPGATRLVSCRGILRDYNNNSDIKNVSAELFDNVASSYGDGNDNNDHYLNTSCDINITYTNPLYDDSLGNYSALYNCSFDVYYYANPQIWNCTVQVFSEINLSGQNSNSTGVSQLMAVNLPQSIDYGNVNSTYISNENATNVSNAGNIQINLSLSGYAYNPGDGLAMNCSKGNVRNISIMYEKYNLTSSNPSGINNLGDLEAVYTNLTNASMIKKFNLMPRINDTFDDAINTTYWRIYVPKGVAGSCSGTILFGAINSQGS